MKPELKFAQPIRLTAQMPAPGPREITSIEDAIDCVQELPVTMLRGKRWRQVLEALWAAADARGDAARLDAAHAALTAALVAEGWLDGTTH
ncbi:MAG: hypothetical protein U1E93_13220 [Alphaproteobacteria bacterium]